MDKPKLTLIALVNRHILATGNAIVSTVFYHTFSKQYPFSRYPIIQLKAVYNEVKLLLDSELLAKESNEVLSEYLRLMDEHFIELEKAEKNTAKTE